MQQPKITTKHFPATLTCSLVDFCYLCGFDNSWLFELGQDALDHTPHNGVPVTSTVRFKFSFDLQGKPTTQSYFARTRWPEQGFFTVRPDEVPDETVGDVVPVSFILLLSRSIEIRRGLFQEQLN